MESLFYTGISTCMQDKLPSKWFMLWYYSQIIFNFIIQKFFYFILCFTVPPYPSPQTYKPSTFYRGDTGQGVGNLPQCCTRLQVTSLPSAQNKARLKHLANICMVSRAVRFIHLLTKVHSAAEKISQFKSTNIYQAPVCFRSLWGWGDHEPH